MPDYKVKRTPLLPPIPKEDEWQKFDRIERWRRSHLTVVEQLHEDAHDDINVLGSNVQELQSNVQTLQSNVQTLQSNVQTLQSSSHSAATVSDTASVNLTITANQVLSADVIQANINHANLANLTTGNPHTQYALANSIVGTTNNSFLVATNYTASTAGIAALHGYNCFQVSIKTPSSALLPCISQQFSSNANALGVTFPINRDATWRAEIFPSNAAYVLYWTPIGS